MRKLRKSFYSVLFLLFLFFSSASSFPSSKMKAKAFEYFREGNELANRGLFKAALIDYKESVRLWPLHSAAQRNIGMLYLKTGDLDRSFQAFQKALSGDDRSHGFLNEVERMLWRIGRAYERKDRPKRAFEVYQLIEKTDLSDIEALERIGLLGYNQDEKVKALSALRVLVKKRPEDTDAYLAVGLLLSSLGNYGEAILSYQHALSLAPERKDIRFRVATTWVEIKRYDKAEKMLKALVEKDDSYVDAWGGLGVLYKITNRPLKSKSAFQKALELDPFYFQKTPSHKKFYQ